VRAIGVWPSPLIPIWRAGSRQWWWFARQTAALQLLARYGLVLDQRGEVHPTTTLRAGEGVYGVHTLTSVAQSMRVRCFRHLARAVETAPDRVRRPNPVSRCSEAWNPVDFMAIHGCRYCGGFAWSKARASIQAMSAAEQLIEAPLK
jgi:hypothetical protein